MEQLSIQREFRPALPTVYGPKDYHEFREILLEMDRILIQTGAEDRSIREEISAKNKPVTEARYDRFRRALRYMLLRSITGYSFRELSVRVADSALFQWFTHTGRIDDVHAVSKSSVERFEKLFDDGRIEKLIHRINRAVADKKGAEELLFEQTALRFDEIFADTTCVKAHIHFPVDWVLLRDGTRTLLKAITLIRKKGLKHRMRPPEELIREMNKLCIEMTHTRKKKDGAKARKRILRLMKRLSRTIEQHALRYKRLLEENRDETDWSEREALHVLARIQKILDQLPEAIRQAHERIIGERRVPNADKILSLYETDLHVLVRGKAGAEVEFGNGLYLAEQQDGLIVDWNFLQDQPPADNHLVQQSIERISDAYGKPSRYTSDRGMDSNANRDHLEELTIFNAICPRSPSLLRERLKEPEFCRLQKRRGSTEARIGLFKNAYLGTPCNSKGFAHRKKRILWCILSHNLWKLARMAAQRKAELELARAA